MGFKRNNIDVGIVRLMKVVKKQIQKAKMRNIDHKLVDD